LQQHRGDQHDKVGHGLASRNGTRLEVLAQPLPVKEVAVRRVPPGADLTLHHGDELDGPGTVHGPREREESFEEPPPLAVVQGAAEDDEDVHVAGRTQALEHGRPVQVRAEDVPAEDVTHQGRDLLGVVHSASLSPA
jgi:hypothetical protein